MEALGTLDELNTALGLARSLDTSTDEQSCIEEVQHLLVQFMAEVASSQGKQRITTEQVKRLEDLIDSFDSGMDLSKGFDLPGANPAKAAVHLARAVARRAERCLWRLDAEEPLSPVLKCFINRVSDLCFVLAVR
jgi:cob(I)alamin adenosyltransferase